MSSAYTRVRSVFQFRLYAGRRGWLVGILILTAWLLGPADAASQSSSLSGRVTDSSGAAVAGAQVVARHQGSGAVHTVTSGPEGLYVLAALPAGSYRVEAQHTGFRTVVRPQVTINVDTAVVENLTLDVGDLAESVTVEAASAPVNVSSPGVSTLVDHQFVSNLPLNGRSFQTLLELTPGVVLSEASITNAGQFSVNGQRSNSNYFMVDGVSANASASAVATSNQQAAGTLPGLTIFGGTNSLVSIDALEEFRVHTSTYSAEFGRSPGAQVSLVTRSGSNRVTARAFEYFRDEALDANDWFRNAEGLEKLPLRQHQFGGVMGGPVVVPGLFDGRNRTFFFYSYEGSRLEQPQPGVQYALVPNAEARQLAQGSLQALFSAFPLPNTASQSGDPAYTGRYLLNVSFPSRFDAHALRLDQQLGRAARLFSRVNYSPSWYRQRVFANGKNEYSLDNLTWTTGLTWTLAPNVVADTRVNYTWSEGRFEFGALAVDGAVLPSDSLLFPSGTSRDNVSVGLQLTSATAANQTLGNMTFGKSLGNQQRQWNVVQSLTWVKAAHELKFAIDYRRLAPEAAFRQRGISYNFGGSVAGALASGGLATVSVQALAPESTFHFDNLSLIAQDTWRASRRLTLSYGVRYEVNPPPTGDRLPYMVQGMDHPLTATLAPAGTRAWKTTYDNIAPRVGATYLVTDDGRFVVRGGFGIFYDLGTGSVLRGFSGYPYNSSKTSYNQSFPASAETLAAAPFVTDPPYSASFYTFDPDLELPRTYQWNVSAERALGARQSITVSYVGAAGRRLLRSDGYGNRTKAGIPIVLLNPALFTSSATVYYTRNAGESNYRALQAQYQRRMSHGLQALASYTWSYSEDNASDESAANLIMGGVNEFAVDPDSEFGPSDFDVRHNFVGSVTWDIPAPSRSGLVRALFGDWGLDGIFRARSGSPITVVTAVTDPLYLTAPRRVDRVSGVSAWLDDPLAPGGKRLNPDAFAVPATGQQGNLGRNSLRSFPVWQLDLSVRKRIGVGGGTRIEIRADAFNLLNTPNFAEPDATLGNSTFGRSTRMLNRALGAGGTSGGLNPLYQIGGPRSMQLSARISFR